MPGTYTLEASEDDRQLVVTVDFPGLEVFTFTIRAGSIADDPQAANDQIERLVAYQVRQRDPRPASEILADLPAEDRLSHDPRNRGRNAR